MKFIPKYRYLKVGEKIRKTDHVLGLFGLWGKVNKTQVGLKVKKLQNSVRRKVGCDIFRDAWFEDVKIYGNTWYEGQPQTTPSASSEVFNLDPATATPTSKKAKSKIRRKKK